MAVRQYVGDRYTIKFPAANETQWSPDRAYEKLEAVQHEGSTYLSVLPVPIGIDIHNEEYWRYWAEPNVQMEQLRQIVLTYDERIADANESVAKYAYPTNNPIFYGADPTGERDSSDAINACIAANHGGQVIFSPGTYRIDSAIRYDYELDYNTCTDFNGAVLVNETELLCAIDVGGLNYSPDHPSGGQFGHDKRRFDLKNFHLITRSTYGIRIMRNFLNVRAEGFEIEAEKNGIVVGYYDGTPNYDDGLKPTDSYIADFVISAKLSADYIGILLMGTDNKVSHGRLYGFREGMAGVIDFVDEVHFLMNRGLQPSVGYDERYRCIVKKNGSGMISNCYCDTYPCFFKADANSTWGNFANITNTFIYAFRNNIIARARLFDLTPLKSKSDGYFTIDGLEFVSGNYPADTQLVYFEGDLNGFTSTAATFVKRSKFKNIAISNYTPVGGNVHLQRELWCKVDDGWIENPYTETGTSGNKWQKLGSIVCPRAETPNLFIMFNGFNVWAQFSYSVNAQGYPTGTPVITGSSFNNNSRWVVPIEIALCTLGDGLVDVFIRRNTDVTMTTNVLWQVKAKYAVGLPAQTRAVPVSAATYEKTMDELVAEYKNVVQITQPSS